DVELGDLHPTLVFTGDLIEDGCDHLAGSTPFGPEVQQHRFAGLQHVGFEGGVRGMDDQRIAHGRLPPVEMGPWVLMPSGLKCGIGISWRRGARWSGIRGIPAPRVRSNSLD